MNVETPIVEKTQEMTSFEKLAQMRDELRVKLHLGKAELRNEWDRLEPKWGELKTQLEKVEEASVVTGKELTVAAKLLMADLKESYERLRQKI